MKTLAIIGQPALRRRWKDGERKGGAITTLGAFLMACDKGSTCLKLSGSRVNQSTINLRRLFVIARGISRVWVVLYFLLCIQIEYCDGMEWTHVCYEIDEISIWLLDSGWWRCAREVSEWVRLPKWRLRKICSEARRSIDGGSGWYLLFDCKTDSRIGEEFAWTDSN